MGFIFDAFAQWVIGVFSGVADLFFKYAFVALGANLSIFEAVFPGIKQLNIGIVGLGMAIAFVLLLCFATLSMSPNSQESVVLLTWNFVVSVILIGIYRPIVDIFLDIINNTSDVFDTVAKGLKIVKSKNQALPTNLISNLYLALKKGMNGTKSTTEKTIMSMVGADIPQKILAFLLTVYIAKKLYVLAKIAIQNYVDLGFLTYLAPIAIAFHTTKATDNYFKSYVQMYVEKGVIVILNGWFVRIILAGFNQIKFASLTKNNSALMQSIKEVSNSSITALGTNTFAVMILWLFIIGSAIEFGVQLNSYISHLGIGGGATLDYAANHKGLGSRITQTAERMATRSVVGKTAALGGKAAKTVGSIVGSTIGGKPGKGGENSNERGRTNSGESSNEIKKSGSNKSSPNPTSAKRNKNQKRKPYSPTNDVKSAASVDNLLNEKMSGYKAKNQLRGAFGNTDALMPEKKARDFLKDKRKEATAKDDKDRLKNALVFDTKSGGKQILSGINSDGKGNIRASLGREKVELKSSEAMKSKYFPNGSNSNNASASTEAPKQTITETASINIGGQKMYYDPIKSPSFHKMMGSVNFNVNEQKPKDRK